MPLTSRQSRPRGSQLPDRLLGRLSPADSGGATLHRQGSDLPDRAGQQQHPPLSRPFSSPLQGYLARPSHGRLVAQAPAPSDAAGKLPPPSRSISIYLCVNVSIADPNYSTYLKHFGAFEVVKIDRKEISAQEYILSELKQI